MRVLGVLGAGRGQQLVRRCPWMKLPINPSAGATRLERSFPKHLASGCHDEHIVIESSQFAPAIMVPYNYFQPAHL